MSEIERIERAGVVGWLHRPQSEWKLALGLTHGAGSNCQAPFLVRVAEEFAKSGAMVLRYDLAFRVFRPKGPPIKSAKQDQESIRQAAAFLRQESLGVPLVLAGHSYGGRQTSMVAAEDPALCDALLLLSYPLHPPGKPEQSRTGHFSSLKTPALFVHGNKDEFGSPEELTNALQLIPSRTALEIVNGVHGLSLTVAASLPAMLDKFLSGTGAFAGS